MPIRSLPSNEKGDWNGQSKSGEIRADLHLRLCNWGGLPLQSVHLQELQLLSAGLIRTLGSGRACIPLMEFA